MIASLDPILIDIALLLGLCSAVSVLFHKLRLPPVVGYVTAGAVLGPNALGLIGHEELVRQLAEVGVVVLLFTVGLELSVRDLARMNRTIRIGGGWQIGLTMLAGTLLALPSGIGIGGSLFVGMLLAMSSTAAVTKLLLDRSQLGAPPGRLALAICVAQDLAVVPCMLVLPLLAGQGDFVSAAAGTGLGMLWLAVTILAAWFVVGRVLDLVARTRSREVLVLTLITLCFGVATITSNLGLSMALGAFVAGAIVATTEYQHEAAGEFEPFRDALSSLFFVSIGMLFDARVILGEPLLVLLALAAVLVGKTVIVVVAGRRVGLPQWVSVRAGMMLAQVGEFSFVLLQAAPADLLPPRFEALFLVVAVLSIALTPAMFALGRALTRRLPEAERGAADAALRDHAIIVGFGPTGQALARVMREHGLRFVAIEMNAATVKAFKQLGYPIFIGDATRAAVLRSAGIDGARLLVLAMNDAEATRRAVTLARRIQPRLRVIARTMFLSEVPGLRELGVSDIVPQELETSVEIIVRVLRLYLVADDEIGRSVAQVREAACGEGRPERPLESARRAIESFVPGVGVEVCRVEPGSDAAGRTLAELELRRRTGCTAVALNRGGEPRFDLGPDTRLEAEDTIMVLGPGARLAQAAAMFRAAPRDPAAASREVLGPERATGLE